MDNFLPGLQAPWVAGCLWPGRAVRSPEARAMVAVDNAAVSSGVDIATASSGDKKTVQLIITLALGGAISFLAWPYLDSVSKGLIVLFGGIACLSIQQGTWMQNHRDLRRQAREDRRQAYTEARKWVQSKIS